MKNDDLFILVIIFVTFFVDFDKGITLPTITSVSANETYNLASSEAMVAYQDLDNAFAEEDSIIPDEICPCKGNKYLTHGDGNKTKCPCENCTCKKVSDIGSVKPEAVPTKVKYQLIKLGAKWCSPCQRWEGITSVPGSFDENAPARFLKRSGWGVDENENSYILTVDVDNCPDKYKKFLNNKDGTARSLPYFIMTVNNEEVESIEGYQGHETLTKLFYRYFK